MLKWVLIAIAFIVVFPPAGKAVYEWGKANVNGENIARATSGAQTLRNRAQTITTEQNTSAKPLPEGQEEAVIDRVLAANIIRLQDGRVVRLAQIDVPNASQCYGGRALAVTRHLLKPGMKVLLGRDPTILGRDRSGQLLRYVRRERDMTFINYRLVVLGVATPYFERQLRGYYGARLERAAIEARGESIGIWRDCRAHFDPYRATLAP